MISVKLTSVPLGCPVSMESASSTMMLGSVNGFRLLTETYSDSVQVLTAI